MFGAPIGFQCRTEEGRDCFARSRFRPVGRSKTRPLGGGRGLSIRWLLGLTSRLLRRSGGWPRVPGPIGLTTGGEYVCVEAEAVEQHGGQLLVAEDLDPLGQREDGGDDRGAPLVAVGELVEELFAAGPLEGHEAEFVDDQQRDAQVALMQAGERVFVDPLNLLSDEVGGGDEGDPLSMLSGLDPEREMGLTGAYQSGDHGVLAAFDVLARGLVGELRLLDPAQHIPVELVQGIEVGEARRA